MPDTPVPTTTAGIVRDALRAAARAGCCGAAACHYEDSGLPCAMVEQVARDAAIIAGFLRALPPGLVLATSPLHLAAAVEETANAR